MTLRRYAPLVKEKHLTRTAEERRAQWEEGLTVVATKTSSHRTTGRLYVLLLDEETELYHLHRYFSLNLLEDEEERWECSADIQRKTAKEMLELLVKELP